MVDERSARRPGRSARRRQEGPALLRRRRPAGALALPAAAATLVALPLALGGCGGRQAAQARLSASQIMSVDAGSRTVDLRLVAADTSSYGGFNFDGYSAGALTVRIPSGWTVVVSCYNGSTVLTHSCAVIDDVPIAPSGGPVAFSGASTPNPVNGITCGSTDTFSFVTTRPGRYRIACLVSGHEADGMWDWLVVTAGGRPSVA